MAYVLNRVASAMRTLRLMPSAMVRTSMTTWPDIVQEFWHAYGYTDPTPPRLVPTPKQITDMDEVLLWLAWLATVDARYPRIVWARVTGATYGKIGKRFNRSRQWAHSEMLNATYLLASRYARK